MITMTPEVELAHLRQQRDHLQTYNSAVLERARKAEAERDALRAATVALIAALPRCDFCSAPATRAHDRGEARYCDEHGQGVPDYPRAPPLRTLLAIVPPAPSGGGS